MIMKIVQSMSILQRIVAPGTQSSPGHTRALKYCSLLCSEGLGLRTSYSLQERAGCNCGRNLTGQYGPG